MKKLNSWLKRLVKEAVSEQKLNIGHKILASREPEKGDFNYEVGAIWFHGDRKFLLESIEASWVEKIDDSA